jgi:hypothetical protein
MKENDERERRAYACVREVGGVGTRLASMRARSRDQPPLFKRSLRSSL